MHQSSIVLMLNKLRLRLFRQEIRYYSQLLNEAEYHLKNYGDRGGCSASAVNTMQLDKFLANDKITASYEINVSNPLYQTFQPTKVNFENMLA